LTAASGLSPRRFVADGAGQIHLADLAAGGRPGVAPDVFRDRSVLISCHRQLPAVPALLALDGIARRIVLCPSDLSPVHVPAVIAEAGVDLIVSDGTGPVTQPIDGLPMIASDSCLPGADQSRTTEWLLFTSGTTGRPKLVVHTLESLTGPLDDGLAVASDAVWSTFYDIRRYGGLTILFRALLGGSSMVLSQTGEALQDFFSRVREAGGTHISGTPSHWRRALMSSAAGAIAPDYIRLSGEIADQAILNNLAAAFPTADIAHAFASTEAGFAFDVRDGMAGFPAAMISQVGSKAEMQVEAGSLRIRSARTASHYVGDGGHLVDADGFVDTGDIVELRGDRYHFVGRREGIINVGGLKVHPEEVEAVINQHPAVQMVRVRGRLSPITGAIVVADIVVRPSCTNSFHTTRDEILAACRHVLPPHKVPAMLHEVPALDVAESGKLVRWRA
jgi:acyl-coenzyme A synthetase/AMP-(fatty) acid ligase